MCRAFKLTFEKSVGMLFDPAFAEIDVLVNFRRMLLQSKLRSQISNNEDDLIILLWGFL